MRNKVIVFQRLSWLLWLFFFISGLTGIYIIWQNSKESTIKVEWSTASEIDTAGFNVYRSENAEGSFEQINTQLIPASGDTLSGGDYSFTDTNVTPGKMYYYELEDVEFNGSSSKYGPVQVSSSHTGIFEIIEYVLAGGVVMIGLIGLVRRLGGKNQMDQLPDET
jgi:hypothetical protein